MTDTFSFNLWDEPWINLERADGQMETLGICQTLMRAHEFRAIYENSPLVVVGIHRLLTAILQAIYDPQRSSDLRRLWTAGRFDEQKIEVFGKQFCQRFDVFSPNVPFMQSADISMSPEKSSKTVGYLAEEFPTGTAVTHFWHGNDDDKVFCQVCVAKRLVRIPAFATSGGAGIKPSINGVPPIYVIPIGQNLFESLSRSLMLPAYLPAIALQGTADAPAWNRNSVVKRGAELNEVGYLQSLTFLARRVRLQPERTEHVCTCCGKTTGVAVRSIVYEMGESRPKAAVFWQDPFAAYREQSDKQPIPIRPTEGKVLWREFNGLFLKGNSQNGKKVIKLLRPRVLDQLDGDSFADQLPEIQAFRCVGMRTDMKAKIFEWIDTSFDVPTALLIDQAGGVVVGKAIECAEEGAGIIFSVFKAAFNASSKNGERFDALRRRMREDYWTSLSGPFRDFVHRLGHAADRDAELKQWVDVVRQHASASFRDAAKQVGDDATSLRQRVQGQANCQKELTRMRNKYLPLSDEERADREAKRAAQLSATKTSSHSKKDAMTSRSKLHE